MGYIGSGPTKFNTADGLTVAGNAEFTGNASFGDSDRAIFGAGSDLQIYHDGSNSYINEQGTGNLKIIGSDISIEGSGETHATFVDDGAVTLYHDNAAKIATTATGVDVSGGIVCSPNTAGKDTFELSTNAVDEGRLRIKNVDTTTVQIRAGGDSYFNGGNVGIGTTSPAAELHVAGASASASTETTIENTNASGHGATLLLKQANTNANSKMVFDDGGTESGFVFDGGANSVLHHVNGSESMRLTSAGKLCVGTSAAVSSAMLSIVPADTNRIINTRSFDTNAQYHHVFQNNSGTLVGGIIVSTSATAYNTSSDYRLKTAVEYDWDATSRLKQLKPARFKWIVDGDDAVSVDGFLAHEVQSIVPESISGNGKDAMMDEEYEVSAAEVDADGNVTKEAVMGTRSVPDLQGIDQSKLVPLLCKTILELEARITALETA